MSRACLICRAGGYADVDVVPGLYCPECPQLLRWFRSYFAHDRGLDLGRITPAMTFQELGVESLDYMNWLLEAEDKFGVTIPSGDADRIMTVGQFLGFLRARGATW